MKEILLTQGRVAIVDDEDFEKLNQFKWHASEYGNTFYAGRNIWLKDKKKNKTIYMHREIMNAQKGIPVDHINGNGLYNRKENLRFCTHQQNHFNIKNPHKDNKLGIKGTHWREDIKKFQAQIQVNGKKINLGCFNAIGDADSIYRIAEEKYFGEFARKEKVKK